MAAGVEQLAVRQEPGVGRHGRRGDDDLRAAPPRTATGARTAHGPARRSGRSTRRRRRKTSSTSRSKQAWRPVRTFVTRPVEPGLRSCGSEPQRDRARRVRPAPVLPPALARRRGRQRRGRLPGASPRGPSRGLDPDGRRRAADRAHGALPADVAAAARGHGVSCGSVPVTLLQLDGAGPAVVRRSDDGASAHRTEGPAEAAPCCRRSGVEVGLQLGGDRFREHGECVDVLVRPVPRRAAVHAHGAEHVPAASVEHDPEVRADLS